MVTVGGSDSDHLRAPGGAEDVIKIGGRLIEKPEEAGIWDFPATWWIAIEGYVPVQMERRMSGGCSGYQCLPWSLFECSAETARECNTAPHILGC
jgi:hypothetical protein